MLRRTPTVLLAIGLTAVTAGCTTVSDNDAVARVNDVELGSDEFEAQLTDAGFTRDEAVSADAARSIITTWIGEQLAAQPVDDEQLAAAYDAGFATSGALCLSVMVVEDEATANDVASQLTAGTAFADLFAELNLDAGLAQTEGALPCLAPADLDPLAGTPWVDAAVELDADQPTAAAPLLDDSGAEVAWAVVNFRPFDELEEADRATLATRNVDADVHVDPLYGTFDQATSQVIPLG